MSPVILICLLLQTAGTFCRNVAENTEREIHSEYKNYDRLRLDEFEANPFNGEESSEELESLRRSSEEKGSRRLFEWMSKFFKTTIPEEVFTTPTTTESIYERNLKDRIFLQELHRNLTQALTKLSDVEKRVTDVIKRKELYGIWSKGLTHVVRLQDHDIYRKRLKREAGKNSDKASSTDIIPLNNTTKVEANLTENISNSSVDVANVTQVPCAKSDDVNSGRRSGTEIITPTEVKKKLLEYLEESFQDIKNKIDSLKSLKQAHSEDIRFKIGYILANIDTLKVNMMNLKKDMDANKQFWDDKHILELYDTLKVSNKAVSGLIDSLNGYVQKLSNAPN